MSNDANAKTEAKSSALPYSTLSRSLEIAAAIKDLGGANRDVSKSALAHRLSVSDNAPSFQQNLISARSFDLIEGRGAYRLTDIAKQYLLPENEWEKRRAKLAMIKSPAVFSELIERFDGSKIPATDVIVNLLHRQFNDITPSARNRVATLFLSAIREADVIDGAGILRYKASLDASSNGNMLGMKTPVVPPLEKPLIISPPAEEPPVKDDHTVADRDLWSFQIGKHAVRLETSHELSMPAWEKLNRIVQALKPIGGGVEK